MCQVFFTTFYCYKQKYGLSKDVQSSVGSVRIQGSSKHLKLDKDLSDQFYNNETVFRKASDTFKLSFLRHNLCLTSCLTENLSSRYTHQPQKFQFNSQVHLIPHRLLIFASAT